LGSAGAPTQPTTTNDIPDALRETMGDSLLDFAFFLDDLTRTTEQDLRHLAQVRDDDFTDVLVRATNDTEVEAIVMTYRERLIDKGRKEGEEAGREMGARRLLAKLLKLKFGALDPAVEAQLSATSLDELEAWSRSVC
jgi:hypothetical protein